jgi:hypothetical protein
MPWAPPVTMAVFVMLVVPSNQFARKMIG